MRNRLPLTKEGRRGCWLHEKSCYGSWRFTRGDRGDWPPRNIAPSSPKGRFFRVKLALDDGTSPTSHAVTRMDSRSRYFTPFSYRGPSSLPASTLSIFLPSRRSGMDWLPFCQNLRGWGDPLIFHLCLLEEFLFVQVLLLPCMTIGCNSICNCEFLFLPLKNPSKFYRCFQTMSASIVQIFKIIWRFFQVSIKNR